MLTWLPEIGEDGPTGRKTLKIEPPWERWTEALVIGGVAAFLVVGFALYLAALALGAAQIIAWVFG